MAKIFLGLIIGLASLQPVWSQEHRADLEWYQNFFQERKRQPVEEELAFYNAKLEQARSANDAAAEAHARMEIGLVHLTRTHDYERALDFFIRSLAIEDSLELKHESMFTYMAMAQVFEVVGDYYKSADFLKQAMRINEQSKDVNVLVVIANRLGRIHAARGQIDEALENYELVLIYKDQLNNSLAEAEALFNLGHLYTQQGKYDEALQSHKQALAIRREAEDKKNEALSLNDIGELYRLMKNEDKALANHQVALEIRLTLKDKKGLAESYNNIAALYFQQQKFELAIAQLQHALDAAQDLQLQDQIRKSYDYFSECYEALGDYKKALHYKDLFLAINDFIQNEKNELRLLETQNRYVINKKESQIEKLESIRAAREKEIEAQRKFGNILVAFIALSLVVVAMIFYLYVVNKRSNKRLQVVNAKVQQQNLTLQELNATKDKFFSIISHDLKGPLNSLTSFSGLLINHIDTLSKEEIQMLAKDLDKSLKNLFALLENLLEWSRSQTGNIEFKPESFDLAMLLEENKELLQGQAHNKKITIVNGNRMGATVIAHKNSVNTVVRNLISNAIKFTPEGGRITLNVQQTATDVQVSVADTGVGMTPEILQKLFRIDTKHTTKGTANEKGTGLGLILCKEFIEKNGGRIWVESKLEKGSIFYFTLPAPR